MTNIVTPQQIGLLEDIVSEHVTSNHTGHDFEHIKRVRFLAKQIAQTESCDKQLVDSLALIHDLGDYKVSSDSRPQHQVIKETLLKTGSTNDIANLVANLVDQISFRGGNNDQSSSPIEVKIVSDADKLDALGAIGIARTFAYGGSKKQPIYNPEIKPKTFSSEDEYKNNKGTTINHFYEKLLLLKDQMHTKKGRELAIKRHQFLEDFLKQFLLEWEN